MASSIKAFPGLDIWSTPGSFASPNKEFEVTFPGLSVLEQKQPAPKMGPGGVLYNSEIIRSLREANKAPMTNNPGVKLLDNPKNSTLTLNFDRAPKRLSNRPQTLKIDPVDPAAYVPTTGDFGGDDGGRIVVDDGGGNDFIFSDYVIDDTDDTDDTDDSWSEWDDWDDPVVEEGTLLDKVDEGPIDDTTDPDPWDPENDGTDPDPWDPENDGTDPDPWDPANDGADPDWWDPANDDVDPWSEWNDWSETDTTDTTGDNKDASVELRPGENITVEGNGIIDIEDGPGGGDYWGEWDDWGDWGDDDLPAEDPFDDRDAFNDVYDFGLGGGGGSRLLDQLLFDMAEN